MLLLWAEALEHGYVASFWMTFRQSLELGAHVRKGEKGSVVVYAATLHKTETDEKTGEDMERSIPFMKGYTLFNVEQIDDLPADYYAKPAASLRLSEGRAHVDRFLAATGAGIPNGGNRAFYAIDLDYVQMPPFDSFRDVARHAATLGHELIHNAAAQIMPHGSVQYREFKSLGHGYWA